MPPQCASSFRKRSLRTWRPDPVERYYIDQANEDEWYASDPLDHQYDYQWFPSQYQLPQQHQHTPTQYQPQMPAQPHHQPHHQQQPHHQNHHGAGQHMAYGGGGGGGGGGAYSDAASSVSGGSAAGSGNLAWGSTLAQQQQNMAAATAAAMAQSGIYYAGSSSSSKNKSGADEWSIDGGMSGW